MDKPKISYAKLLLRVGSMCFFESSKESFFGSRHDYYWKFENATEYYGPFMTLLDAGLSATGWLSGGSSPITQALLNNAGIGIVAPVVDNKNIIEVDFKTKRRIKK